jgi:hypothetical protein
MSGALPAAQEVELFQLLVCRLPLMLPNLIRNSYYIATQTSLTLLLRKRAVRNVRNVNSKLCGHHVNLHETNSNCLPFELSTALHFNKHKVSDDFITGRI